MSQPNSLVRLDAIDQFDCLIDARSPAEYEEDHLPGAINCPVLDNAQRAEVGTLYVQASPFEARKVGAAMVFENIARHLREQLAGYPRKWRPLVYCWRGGQRSGAFTWALRQIGWDACQLIGGYKTYRHAVVENLSSQPQQFDYRVLSGPTGSGKTLLLQTLASEGAQVLDLEALACHRGSVLGSLPGRPQPSQKAFESALHVALKAFDPGRPVFIEAESRRIGRLNVPETLLAKIRSSPCIQLETAHAARLDYLLKDYRHLGDDPADLQSRLSALQGLHSNETLTRWLEWAGRGDLAPLFEALMQQHYDPLYARSQARHRNGETQRTLTLEALDPTTLLDVARHLLS